MANKKSQRDSLSSWILPIFLLMIFPPLGVLLLVLKLLDSAKKPRKRHPYYDQKNAQGPTGARTTQGAAQAEAVGAAKKTNAAKKRKDPTAALASKGKALTFAGSVILVIVSFVLLACIGDSAHWLLDNEWAWFVEDMLELLPFFCAWFGGLGCLIAGRRKTKKASRYRNYLAMIGRQTSISISALSSATGRSPAKVRDDLADMLDEGLFPQGFLDYGGDRLVLTSDGLCDTPKSAATPDENREDAILAEIRAVNDSIDNPKLSAQIDRIGVITAKILDYQKNRPDKAPQLHSFLSYYLPTTLKILRAYGQLESQPVSGENIVAAMQRIEGMMDKVVEGFEKQLDLLFRDDVMDITSDVEVLERMLAKDGLSGSGMTLNL